MKSSHSIANYLVVGAAALLLAACSTQMEPAKKALDDISSTVQAAPADADQYIPDQVAEVKRKLSDLNASFTMKDYAAVLAGAPALLTEARGLAAAATAKKDAIQMALVAQWTELSAAVPPLVTTVRTQVDTLSKVRRVPKGADLAAAKSGLGDAVALWDKAQAAFQSNHIADAVTAANDAKAKAEAAAAALNTH